MTDAQILNVINNIHRRLQRESPYIFEEARVTGTISTVTTTLQTWDLPSDMKAPVRFYYISSGYYFPVYYEEFHAAIEEFAFSEDSDEPFRYAIHSTVGYLFPRLTSATQYEFFYSKILDDFSAVTSSNAILQTLPEALEFGATAEYYDFLGEKTRAEVWRVKASDAVQSLIKQVHLRKEASQTAVPTTYGTIGRQR